MKKMLLLFLIPLMSLSVFDYEGYPDWENFISADFVRDIDSSGDSLWVTTNGGLYS